MRWQSSTVRCVLRTTRARGSHKSCISDMHPLALEDVLHFRKNARSKADYYMKHLFLRVLCHTLCSDEELAETSGESSFTDLPRSSSPTPMEYHEDEDASFDDMKQREDERGMYGMETGSRYTSRNSTLRNTVRRRFSRTGDVETPRPSGSRQSSFASPSSTVSVSNILSIQSLMRHATPADQRCAKR